nr:hypothetical protein [uncultured Nitrososphaera sp.]
MALANGDKAAICSVVVAVGVVLGLIVYGPYVKDKAPIPVLSSSNNNNSTPVLINETPGVPQEGSAREQNNMTQESTTTPIAQTGENKEPAINDGLTLVDMVDSSVVSPPQPDPDAAVEPKTIMPAQPVLDCSVPASVPQDSQLNWSAILLDSSLQPAAGQTIAWQVSPGGYSFSSVTQTDGTAATAVNLSGIAPGIYNVTATFDGNLGKAMCTVPLEITKIHSSSNMMPGSSSAPGGDIIGPELKITSPIGPKASGSSSGVFVKVTGTASDASNIARVEVRWTATWGLTGYRMATPTEPNNWSSWSYDGIKFTTEGEKTILVKATDGMGNSKWKVVTFTVEFTEDKISTSVREGAVVGATLHLTGTATKFNTGQGVQTVEVRTDLSGYEQATPDTPGDWSVWSHDLTFTTNGPHQVIVRVTDNAGKMYWLTTNVTVQL